jgi:predicted nucleic acid-binding protein
MTVVSNSTALVHLSAMGRLQLLRTLFGEVQIPAEVYDEVVVRVTGQPGASEVASAAWIHRQAIGNQLAFRLLTASLGAGEAACIVLAAEMNADLLILDDRAARLQAQALGISVTGTVGILLAADGQGLLEFQEALDELLATGFRLSPVEYRRVVAQWQATRSAQS